MYTCLLTRQQNPHTCHNYPSFQPHDTAKLPSTTDIKPIRKPAMRNHTPDTFNTQTIRHVIIIQSITATHITVPKTKKITQHTAQHPPKKETIL